MTFFFFINPSFILESVEKYILEKISSRRGLRLQKKKTFSEFQLKSTEAFRLMIFFYRELTIKVYCSIVLSFIETPPFHFSCSCGDVLIPFINQPLPYVHYRKMSKIVFWIQTPYDL